MTTGIEKEYTGLEDFDEEPLPVPRLKIDHETGTFEESGSGLHLQYLDCVILGLTRQRTFWDPDMDSKADDKKPRCKSNNAELGIPNIHSRNPSDLFPWEGSNFKYEDQIKDDDGNAVLPCASCAYREWGEKPDGKRVPPPCTELLTLSIQYYRADPEDTDTPEDQKWTLGVIQFSKTGFKPTKDYLNSFRVHHHKVFSKVTRITLEANRQGMVKWFTPKFEPGQDRPPIYWPDDQETSQQMRSYLSQPPRHVNVAQIEQRRQLQLTGGPVVETAPVAATATAPAVTRPVATPPPPAATPKFDPTATPADPWASDGVIDAPDWPPAPVEAPVSAVAASTPPPAAAPPASAPVAVTATAPPFAAPPPPPPPPAPGRTATVPAPSAGPGTPLADTVIDTDDLPF